MKRSLMFLFALVVSLAMLFTTQSTMATGPAPAPRPQSDPSIVGAWGPVTNLNSISSGAIVAIHTSLLPNGKVLVFTRQQASDGNDNVNGFSRTYVWDPATNSVVSEAFNGTTNLFCSGHAFIHDGRLLVTGGHLGGDLRGEPDANFYDWNTGAWSSAASMGRGRWYPTNVALGNSEMLVDAGFDEFQQINGQPQVWQTNNTWRPLSSALDPHSNTYPWLHLAPNGQVFHSGPREGDLLPAHLGGRAVDLR